MNIGENTLFLRLAGPMQSWGTSSRFQLRRTDTYPSKSGVLGMLLCAMGVRREDSRETLTSLASLVMGVRVDLSGALDWDYHTAGAKIGIRSADGKVKKTASTGEYETLLSRRQYLYDASFLVALNGDSGDISKCAHCLDDPVWPLFLGRKCCVPTEPVFAGVGSHENVAMALASVPWRPRSRIVERNQSGAVRTLNTFIEHPPGTPPPEEATLVYDAPRAFGYFNYGPRWVVKGQVTVPAGESILNPRFNSVRRKDPYASEWDTARLDRLEFDNYLCVFCKSPAVEVHHLDYEDVRRDTLRSLCKICHRACTMLEYGHDMRRRRIDPSDPKLRPEILRQINHLVETPGLHRGRELLSSARTFYKERSDTRLQEPSRGEVK